MNCKEVKQFEAASSLAQSLARKKKKQNSPQKSLLNQNTKRQPKVTSLGMTLERKEKQKT